MRCAGCCLLLAAGRLLRLDGEPLAGWAVARTGHRGRRSRGRKGNAGGEAARTSSGATASGARMEKGHARRSLTAAGARRDGGWADVHAKPAIVRCDAARHCMYLHASAGCQASPWLGWMSSVSSVQSVRITPRQTRLSAPAVPRLLPQHTAHVLGSSHAEATQAAGALAPHGQGCRQAARGGGRAQACCRAARRVVGQGREEARARHCQRLGRLGRL